MKPKPGRSLHIIRWTDTLKLSPLTLKRLWWWEKKRFFAKMKLPFNPQNNTCIGPTFIPPKYQYLNKVLYKLLPIPNLEGAHSNWGDRAAQLLGALNHSLELPIWLWHLTEAHTARSGVFSRKSTQMCEVCAIPGYLLCVCNNLIFV